MKVRDVRLLVGGAPRGLSGALPAVALAGRSNVGKSSLLNRLLNWRVARVSAVPGKTQAVHAFVVNDTWCLVDLPGYGWARVGRAVRSGWASMVKEYLLQYPALVQLLLLIDLRHAPQQRDLDFITWAVRHRMAFSLVFTKADLVDAATQRKHQQLFREVLAQRSCGAVPFFVTSARKRWGEQALLAHMAACLHVGV